MGGPFVRANATRSKKKPALIGCAAGWRTWIDVCRLNEENMSVHEIIAELPKLSEEERELILRRLVNLEEPFEPTPAMEDAIREGLRSLRGERTYSAAEVRSRIAAWTAR
jgi:hypothetical protein